MKRERARRELEEKEREEWKLLSPHLSPEKPSFEPFSEAEMREELTARDEERSEWLFSRRSALPAPVPSCERSKTVPTAEMARNKHQLDPQRYTDLSLHWGPTRDATGTLMHSESLARWQQHVQTFPNTNGASAAGIKDREPLPRKYLWSKEDGLAGRVASWDADEGRKFWRGWSAHSEMAHEGVSKAGKRDALERAKAMREKYGGLTLEKARIVVASLSKKKADAFTSEELELFERAKKYLIEVHQERASTAAAAASGSKRIPRKPWDARWIHASRSFGNEERMPQRRRCFSSFPKRPEAYLDKMLGRMTSVTEKLLTADERKLKDEFLGKVNALALKKAEREAAQANKKKK
ncbi:unnamed protein product [Amoebophrya sp. A25]|nr:unnamed protein product [Amoebophrya sp. A25]|eukprot:GSA25T00016100001.1